MAKRSRKDFSDPRIRRLVRAQFTKKSVSNSSGSNDEPSLFRALGVFFLVLSLGAALAYTFFNWDQIQAQYFQPNTVQSSETLTTQPLLTENNTPEAINAVENDVPESQDGARKIQVEVLNGCGIAGIADRFTRFLRSKNIDVVSTGNYISFSVRQSRILDRVGNAERVQAVAEILKLAQDNIENKPDANLQLDATIILGADYKQLAPFK